MQVPVGRPGFLVPHPCGQRREARLDVRAVAEPADEGGDREGVTQAVQHGTAGARTGRGQAGPADQHGEYFTGAARGQPGAGGADEERGNLVAGAVPGAPPRIAVHRAPPPRGPRDPAVPLGLARHPPGPTGRVRRPVPYTARPAPPRPAGLTPRAGPHLREDPGLPPRPAGHGVPARAGWLPGHGRTSAASASGPGRAYPAVVTTSEWRSTSRTSASDAPAASSPHPIACRKALGPAGRTPARPPARAAIPWTVAPCRR